jgi:WD40 repeat protein
MYLFGIIFSSIIIMSFVFQGNYSTSFEGQYFGQKFPGSVPELFGKGIIPTSHDLHSCPVFSRDGKIVFWRVMNSGNENGVYFSQWTDKSWSVPQKAPFIETNDQYNNDVPYFSPSSALLYLTSDRPYENQEQKKRIWYTKRENGTWIEPKLFEKINPKNVMLHWQFSISRNNTFYLTGMSKDGTGSYEIFKAELLNENYMIEKLDSPINSKDSDICPFIAPDESYLIFCSSNRDEGYGKTDLYICFKTLNGAWSAPLNMGAKINSTSQDWCPIVSNDGKYLFFTSFRNGNCNAYWVDSDIIEELRDNIQ